jgi:prepilin-type N-terminal cleavage/methylation domain-containing protein
MYESQKRQGFTLAEVLVTLAIIGVVAAITIPTLLQTTNAAKYTTGVKKAVSELNSVIQTQMANNNLDASSTTGADAATATAALAAYMKANLNVLKDSGDGTLWLADGSKIQFHGLAAGCADIANPSNFAAASSCYALIDVNGDKGPNTVASDTVTGDIYILGIGKTAVVPVIPQDVAGVAVAFNDISDDPQDITGSPIAATNDASFKAITTN